MTFRYCIDIGTFRNQQYSNISFIGFLCYMQSSESSKTFQMSHYPLPCLPYQPSKPITTRPLLYDKLSTSYCTSCKIKNKRKACGLICFVFERIHILNHVFLFCSLKEIQQLIYFWKQKTFEDLARFEKSCNLQSLSAF